MSNKKRGHSKKAHKHALEYYDFAKPDDRALVPSQGFHHGSAHQMYSISPHAQDAHHGYFQTTDIPGERKSRLPSRFVMWIITMIVLVNFTIALVLDMQTNKNNKIQPNQSPAITATSPTKSLLSDNNSTINSLGATLPITMPDGSLKYQNNDYKFSFTMPISWSKINIRAAASVINESVKPLARFIFEATTPDTTSVKQEIMKIRVDNSEGYLQLVESLKDNPNSMPTYIGKSGQYVVSLETALPPASAVNSVQNSLDNTVNPGSITSYDYTKDVRSVLQSFASP